MKYPKFTREENKACKLNDTQIKEVVSLRKRGLSYQAIADKFNMSLQGIRWWCLTEDQRKEITKNRKRKKYDFDLKEYRQRKIETHPELREYENQFTWQKKLETRPKAKLTAIQASRNYQNKNPDLIKKKNKEYQLAHLDKFREYNKKHREKIQNEI